MIDKVWATERESEESAGVHEGVQAPSSVGAHHQLDTDPMGHSSQVVQRLTDGHIAIVCHDGQKDGFCGAEYSKEEKLCDAAIERNYISLCEEAHQELWRDG